MSTTNILDLNNRIDALEKNSGGGGTSNYNGLTNKPQINSVELSGNKTAAQLGLMASDGVVANPTGQTTGTLTALEVDGTKYAVSGGSGTSDYTDLTNKPSINGVTLSGNKTTSDLGINATNVILSDGVTSVENEIDRKNVANITKQVSGLTSYSSASNPYTCPCDGYVRIVGTASTMATMFLLTEDGTNNYNIGQTKDMYISIFVRKDAKVFFENAVNASFLRL